jgi:hypothetical protein
MHRYHLLKLLLTLFLFNILLDVYLAISWYGLHVFMKNSCNLYNILFFIYRKKRRVYP